MYERLKFCGRVIAKLIDEMSWNFALKIGKGGNFDLLLNINWRWLGFGGYRTTSDAIVTYFSKFFGQTELDLYNMELHKILYSKNLL